MNLRRGLKCERSLQANSENVLFHLNEFGMIVGLETVEHPATEMGDTIFSHVLSTFFFQEFLVVQLLLGVSDKIRQLLKPVDSVQKNIHDLF